MQQIARDQAESTTSEVFSTQDVETIFMSLIGAITKAVELRDEYTSHHQANVALLAAAIAQKMGFDADRVLGVRLGALVHDLGKIALPSEILNKTGNLNDAEIAMIQLHPRFGAEIFREVDTPWPILEIVEQHHERLDGSGYPKHLKGSSIAIEAQIVAVADTFDAMASDRPYRHAPGVKKAIEVLKKDRGIKYDSDAVDALVDLVDHGFLTTDLAFQYAD